MKYEVTGDTIIIKYIADGKYKQLELDKNDNIDLDFFGQLIKAKNNKQDAMCDLYAKEVLSYEPAAERISNMSLTKVEEPSEYTKKEAAKLRIEELNRDLKLVEKEIENMLLPAYKHKKPDEELKKDYFKDKDDKETMDKVTELISKYKSIKKMIEKEQKTYDENSKDYSSQDQFLNKITKEFESKINKVVKTSEEQKEATEYFKNSLNPYDTIKNELTESDVIIKAIKELLPKLQDNDDDSSIDDDNTELEDINEQPLKFNDITKNLNLLIDHIDIIISLLEKTTIDNDIIQQLKRFPNIFKELINNKVVGEISEPLKELNELLLNINQLNDDKKIEYTKTTQDNIVRATNKILSENERLQYLYEKNIEPKFIDNFCDKIKENLFKDSIKIVSKNDYILTSEKLNRALRNIGIILLWCPPKSNNIYCNINLWKICGDPIELIYSYTKDKIKYSVKYECYQLPKSKFQNYKYSLFRNYITTTKTKFPITTTPMNLYLNLRNTSKPITIDEIEFTCTGFKLEKNPMASFIDIVSGYGEGINSNSIKEMYSGKIDLDKASTEDKLSEIVRLLQNIGYNLFTLTPNYEESEKNKRLKSKGVRSKNSGEGVDLQEYFKNKQSLR